MTIPKTFKLFSTTWHIKNVNKIDSEGSFGICKHNSATIEVRKNLRKDIKEATYCHELMHAMLETLGYSKLSNDEKFVENMGQALHQVLTTSI